MCMPRTEWACRRTHPRIRRAGGRQIHYSRVLPARGKGWSQEKGKVSSNSLISLPCLHAMPCALVDDQTESNWPPRVKRVWRLSGGTRRGCCQWARPRRRTDHAAGGVHHPPTNRVLGMRLRQWHRHQERHPHCATTWSNLVRLPVKDWWRCSPVARGPPHGPMCDGRRRGRRERRRGRGTPDQEHSQHAVGYGKLARIRPGVWRMLGDVVCVALICLF